MKFLPEPEATGVLRCSTSKIKRLRLAGHLRYVRGRPVLIAEEELQAYIAATTRATVEQHAASEAAPVISTEARARQRARQRWLRRSTASGA